MCVSRECSVLMLPAQFENFSSTGSLNLAGPPCWRPINEAAKLINWALNWPLSLRALLPPALSAPPALPPLHPSLAPSLPPPDITIPPCHNDLGSAPQTGRCSRRRLPPPPPPASSSPPPATSGSPLHQYLPPTPSRCFMSASQQVGREREAEDDGVSGGLIPALL